tara:strand:- start:732 stop:1508 length:777 start_codon:yes stop_codon:yes gene_type:complete
MGDVENQRKVTFQEVNQEDKELSEEVSKEVTTTENKCRSRISWPLTCCGAILLIVSLVVLFSVSLDNMSGRLAGTNIEGSVRYHNNNHHKTCDDEKYGCCEIYTDCKVKGQRLEYEPYKLSRYRILPHNSIKSNCPSLGYLITEYNKHYGNMTTDCGQYGCCPGFNIGCDETIRGTFTQGNNQETIGQLRVNSENMNILIPKEDTLGTNCKQGVYLMIDLKYSYEHYYPDKSDDFSFLSIFLGLMVLGGFLAWLGSKG